MPHTLEDEFSCFERERAQAWLEKKGAPADALGWVANCDIVTDGTKWKPAAEGQPAIVVPVLDGEWIDLVAWMPAKPAQWFTRRGTHSVLGWHDLKHAITFARPVRVHATPLDWLMAGMEGCVPLTVEAGGAFLGCVAVEGPQAVGDQIIKELKAQYVFPNVVKK